MTNLESFTLALRRAAQAHPELRLGQLMQYAANDLEGYIQSLMSMEDADLTEALNRFADKGR